MKAGAGVVHCGYLLWTTKRTPSFFPIEGMVVLAKQGRICVCVYENIHDKIYYFNHLYFIVF